MIVLLSLPEGSADVLKPLFRRTENLLFYCVTLWRNLFTLHSPAAQVLKTDQPLQIVSEGVLPFPS